MLFRSQSVDIFSSTSRTLACRSGNGGASQSRLPGERCFTSLRIDAAIAERLDERDAVAEPVVRHEIGVGRDQRAQILAEDDVDRRAIVERADAHVQDLAGDLARLARQPVDEIGRDRAVGQDAGAAGGEPQQIGGPALVDLQEGIEHRGDQHRAAVMRSPVASS